MQSWCIWCGLVQEKGLTFSCKPLNKLAPRDGLEPPT
uniref:Uncharacterized protein n=1 Tax=Myoviridae sp. ctEg02 TaxID=2825061 RepID=A0A8S5PQG2_9CAUD|nr:MAG TPA: protein of unknown function (DUF4187) [Myoviridae sp. ctEg02]